MKNDKQIIYVGNYIYEGSQCGVVISEQSDIFTCLAAGCHGYVNSNILEIKDEQRREQHSDMDI